MDLNTVSILVRLGQSELLAQAMQQHLVGAPREPRLTPGLRARLTTAQRRLRSPGKSARVVRPSLEQVL